MNELCKEHFPRQLENLQTIPGVKERSDTAIVAELGVDMKTFLTASALVSGCGLKPRNEESAGKIKSRRIRHGNKYLRKTLIECAWAASRTQGSFFNKFSYVQVTVRKKNQMKVRSSHCPEDAGSHLAYIVENRKLSGDFRSSNIRLRMNHDIPLVGKVITFVVA